MEEDDTKSNTYLLLILFGLFVLLAWVFTPTGVEKGIENGDGLYCEYYGDELLCDGEYYASTGYGTPEHAESEG